MAELLYAHTAHQINYGDDFNKEVDKHFAILQAQDDAAKAKGTLVGRYLRHQIADGYAFYQVIRENKSTVRIRVCIGLGDDWTIPAWGVEATIPKKLALEFLGRQDMLRALFGKNV